LESGLVRELARGRRAAALAGAIGAFLVATGAASAATFEVTKRGDPPPGSCTRASCSLREAVIAANQNGTGGDRIVLPSRKPYRLTIPEAMTGAQSGDLEIANGSASVVHPGRGRATIDANGHDRVFDVAAGAPLRLKRIAVTGGDPVGLPAYGGGIQSLARLKLVNSVVRSNGALDCGGGIHVQSGAPLILDRSLVVDNRAGGNGGGISASCLGNAGPVTIAGSTISDNRSDLDGTGNGYGGGIYLQTAAGVQSTIERSTLAGNRTGPGGLGASDGGGIYTDLGRLRISGSTISGNRAGDVGGGIHVDGTKPLAMVNSTVASNRANDNGGGIALDTGEVSLNAVTVVRNRGNADGDLSEAGGGLFYGNGTFAVENSLIALNTLTALTPGDPPVKNDCSSAAPFQSAGHNLLSTIFLCQGFDQPGDLTRTDPMLGSLKDRGGPTQTVSLLKGSPAIGKAKRSSSPARDQRGRKRDRRPDIGAFER
jgi:hypothetical protein